jgi:hypothetical protein
MGVGVEKLLSPSDLACSFDGAFWSSEVQGGEKTGECIQGVSNKRDQLHHTVPPLVIGGSGCGLFPCHSPSDHCRISSRAENRTPLRPPTDREKMKNEWKEPEEEVECRKN